MSPRLVHITIGKANPHRANGVNAVVHGLCEALHKSGVDVEVWGITPTPDEPTFERPYPLRLFQYRRHRWGLDPSLRRALQGLGPETLVHFHGGLLPEFFFAARELKRRSVKWVLTPHGAYAPGAQQKSWVSKKLFLRFFDKLVIGNAARLHGLAPGSTRGLPSSISTPPIVVIPNGYSQPEAPFADLTGGPFCFSFCGRIDIYTKGLDYLIEGLCKAIEQDSELLLELVGDGPDRADLQLLIDAKVPASAVLLGALFGAAKRRVLVQSDCFVLTSRHEGFPMSLSEAASLGLPLIVTEETNFAGYVRDWDCGIVAKEATANGVAEAMLAMAQSPPERLAEMGANAVRLIRAELNWDHIATRVQEELYQPIEDESK